MTDKALSNFELIRLTSTVNGMRVRFPHDLSAALADELIRRGLAELAEDVDEFVPGAAHKCLRVTQHGFDLVLGRIDP